MCHTRYGKSLVVALAVLTRITTFPEKWVIVAPSFIKARIIMGYIIDHLFDNEYTKSLLVSNEGEKIEHLQQERNKDHLTFKLGMKEGKPLLSEVYVLSADSRNKLSSGDSLMGQGSSNLVLDEAALIDDNIEAKVFRMLGDCAEDSFYLKIGNPFRRNHFYKSSIDKNYFHLNVDYQQGIEEGRLTESFVTEAKKKPHFDVLYENKFPDEDMLDDQGYTSLINQSEIERSFTDIPREACVGAPRLSVDVAGEGSNLNVWILRYENYAEILAKADKVDTMDNAVTTIRLAKENNVDERNTFIDKNGIGKGVFDMLHRMNFNCVGVMASEKADEGEDEQMFVNRRAQNYWRLRDWIIAGGRLDEAHKDDWMELLNIKYKAIDNRKIQIMPKLQMARLGIDSPDCIDALAQSFDNKFVYDKKLLEKETEKFDAYSL